jgi:hypothetical protein
VSKKGDIFTSLATAIATVTTANGYDTNIIKVFADQIPMGLDLDDYELPAVLVIAGPDKIKHEHQCIRGAWFIDLQLIHRADATSQDMLNFCRDINKAIYANSPTATRTDAWRIWNGKPFNVLTVNIEPDLNLIEGNRFAIMTHLIEYHTTPTEL